MEQQIRYINTENLHWHPQNPRTEAGDLTELAESIRTRGILQNLTVVPYVSKTNPNFKNKDNFTVVIGHRRLEAAKLAGLTEVPCIVADMDEKEQLSTMLLENIQRSDLSIAEQAKGFQLMFDLGETVKTISEKTGFSKDTIKKRVSLLKYDTDKLKAAECRGGTLQDFCDMNCIEDPVLRNKVLETVGTANFRAQLQSAKDSERIRKNRPGIIAQLNRFAKQSHDVYNKAFVASYYLLGAPEIIVAPADASSMNYYWNESGHYIYLYKDRLKTFEETREELQAEKLRHDADVLEELSKSAYKLRVEFMKKYDGKRSDVQICIDAVAREFCECIGEIEADTDVLCDILGIDAENEELDEVFRAEYIKNPMRTFCLFAYSMLEHTGARYFNSRLEYKASCILDDVYEFLQKLGYELSDEELSLKNGTHKLLRKEV